MSDTNFPEWQIELDASKLKYPLEYKFILYNKQEKKADCWEKNPNRYLADPELKTNETLVISDRYVYFDIPAWKGAGIAIPVFSETYGRLGSKYSPESYSDFTGQRHHHDSCMDGLLSL